MYFLDTPVFIEGNQKLRKPQIEAYLKIQGHFKEKPNEQALVVLPTGTGKSGLISIAPFGVSHGRVLIITPNKVTRASISKTMDTLEDNFWINSDVIFNIEDNPILVAYDKDVLDSELEEADIVYTNVQKLNPNFSNSLLNRVGPEHFDMLIIDEAHHSPANTWQSAIKYFNKAKVLHVTGTPYRGDGVVVPGKKIHETKLSEVMEQRYVKWLRNSTIGSTEISFVKDDGKILTLEEAKELNDEEWVQKSVALSDECSLEVIRQSIKELDQLKKLSPNVPHKIMASACNIAHAKRLEELYSQERMVPILIHSNMPEAEQAKRFKDIENHKCNVVIQVGMMGEGYDHKYLTIATLFRPYKSLNMFAQIIGRVLRAIPEEEITKHEIDNNAIVIYHKELGMEKLWDYFRKEVQDVGKYSKVKEIDITDQEFERRETIYGKALTNGELVEFKDSYSSNIDFNEEFEKAKRSIDEEANVKRKQLKELGWDDEDIDEAVENLTKKKLRVKNGELNKLYNEKRPLERRKMIKKLLKEKIELLTIDLLNECKIDPKGSELYNKLKKYLPQYIKAGTKNDGVLVIFINTKLKIRFAGRDEMEIEDLMRSEEYLSKVLSGEVRRILNGITN
ncbi:DEAD/DEAH box helicase [Desulfitobacterium metallireducens]|uniref:Type III restriction enzyme, res subunit n=1 Tax=Desulfitobacterium metallireducens DSM 15288 TaxID=871968 RepID=W0E8I6_9FIRM|nr:DEAD/DEAH box helicase family protein [Desulfitobacterium metallireducens]AHF05828.1 type III restriction enzyme, res subunit [Desulfitobacterium metallireducens DSM 15288]